MVAERQRDHCRLDRPRVAEAEVANPFQQALIEVERRERYRCGVHRHRFEQRWRRRRGVLCAVRQRVLSRAATLRPYPGAATRAAVGAFSMSCVRVQMLLG